MKITINTTIDQDVGLEAFHAQVKSDLAIDKFAEQILNEYLNAIVPRMEVAVRERLKREIDQAVDAKIVAIEEVLKTP